ncbi:MAG: hypothetical protein AAF518_27255 [Spirochaetota bacterium]
MKISQINAELTRNFWIELTPNRIFMMPIILGLLFLLVGIPDSSRYSTLLYASGGMIFFLLHIWGNKQVADAVIHEVNERTWDNQRLTLIRPFELAIGKLFGSTMFPWYGCIYCIALYVYCSLHLQDTHKYIMLLGHSLLSAILTHSFVLSISILGIQKKRNQEKISGTYYYILGIALSFALLGFSIQTISQDLTTTLHWYFTTYAWENFYLFSLLCFFVWSFTSLFRCMRKELNYSNGAIVWVGFLLFLAIYIIGFTASIDLSKEGLIHSMPSLLLIYTAYHCICFFMAFNESKDIVALKIVYTSLKTGNLRDLSENIPLWLVTLVISAITAILYLLSGIYSTITNGSSWLTNNPTFFTLSLLSFLLRDIGILYLSNASPKSKRGDIATIVYLALLYLLIPSTLHLLGIRALDDFFYPNIEGKNTFSFSFPLLQAILTTSIAFYKYKRNS